MVLSKEDKILPATVRPTKGEENGIVGSALGMRIEVSSMLSMCLELELNKVY